MNGTTTKEPTMTPAEKAVSAINALETDRDLMRRVVEHPEFADILSAFFELSRRAQVLLERADGEA